jgi:hypothetical protein
MTWGNTNLIRPLPVYNLPFYQYQSFRFIPFMYQAKSALYQICTHALKEGVLVQAKNGAANQFWNRICMQQMRGMNTHSAGQSKWAVCNPTKNKNLEAFPHTRKNKCRPLHSHSWTWLLIGCMEILFLKLAATIFGVPKNTLPLPLNRSNNRSP